MPGSASDNDVVCVALQLIRAMEKSYVISVNSIEDIKNLYRSLGLVRSLLMVQVGPDEEELLKQSIWSVLLTGLYNFFHCPACAFDMNLLNYLLTYLLTFFCFPFD